MNRKLSQIIPVFLRHLNGYKLGMAGIFVFSLILRFWNLTQFNTLVFDEVYYAKFGNYYLTGTPFFQSHPPLGQYIMALGIWLGSHWPTSPEIMNTLTGSLRSTLSYRWLNALTGSFIPLVVGAIAYELTQKRTYALIAALFLALDGLFLVESRYALNNIYLILFGLIGHLCFLLSLKEEQNQVKFLMLSGVFLGLCFSIKWNGLAFLLGIYLIIFLVYLEQIVLILYQSFSGRFDLSFLRKIFLVLNQFQGNNHKFKKIIAIDLRWISLSLLIVPPVIYSLLWIPHLILNPEYNFFQVHQKIFAFHQSIGGNLKSVHPYCSPWYSWLILWRPVAYFYEKKVANNQVTIYDVHAMGNPFLWVLSTLAIFIVLFLFVKRIIAPQDQEYSPVVIIYLTVNYICNLLPWLKISRCTFIYHYMGSYVFAILALAWLVDRWLKSQIPIEKITGIATTVVIIIAFIHWLPVYLGLPLSQLGFDLRILFPNWV